MLSQHRHNVTKNTTRSHRPLSPKRLQKKDRAMARSEVPRRNTLQDGNEPIKKIHKSGTGRLPDEAFGDHFKFFVWINPVNLLDDFSPKFGDASAGRPQIADIVHFTFFEVKAQV